VKECISPCWEARTGAKIGMGANLLVAALAGCCNVLITEPLDTLSTRRQVASTWKAEALEEAGGGGGGEGADGGADSGGTQGKDQAGEGGKGIAVEVCERAAAAAAAAATPALPKTLSCSSAPQKVQDLAAALGQDWDTSLASLYSGRGLHSSSFELNVSASVGYGMHL